MDSVWLGTKLPEFPRLKEDIHADVLIIGGGGHRTGVKGGGWDELRAFAKEHYPQAEEKYFRAAQDCMSLDGVPYIGQYSKRTPNLYVACGFNKWGICSPFRRGDARIWDAPSNGTAQSIHGTAPATARGFPKMARC